MRMRSWTKPTTKKKKGGVAQRIASLNMAEKPDEREYGGGYNYGFIGKVSDRFICQMCNKVLRDPHLAVCCGQHFCETCLNKWFTRQGKESCPHCRAEGEGFKHVINKSLRSEVNQLKIKCSNHGEGCQWTGELGKLKKHLESAENGCDFALVECPNKCNAFCGVRTMKRKDVCNHLTQSCHLRPYQCEFCGLKDTYFAITGGDSVTIEDVYFGHQAECPEVPLTCPNDCKSETKIKRKDMVSHRSQCPLEPVRCPFADAGCKVDVSRQQLEDHMTTDLQQHVTLLLIDHKQLKEELNEVKSKLVKAETDLAETKETLQKTEAELTGTKCEIIDEIKSKLGLSKPAAAVSRPESLENKLKSDGDWVKLIMGNFSEYRRTGKVWHSPPFYYREGYKMCLAVYANGIEEGAGTHISVALLHSRGEYDDVDQLTWPKDCRLYLMFPRLIFAAPNSDGFCSFHACDGICRRPAVNELMRINHQVKFCSLNSKKILHLVDDSLVFCVKLNSSCLTGCCVVVKLL